MRWRAEQPTAALPSGFRSSAIANGAWFPPRQRSPSRRCGPWRTLRAAPRAAATLHARVLKQVGFFKPVPFGQIVICPWSPRAGRGAYHPPPCPRFSPPPARDRTAETIPVPAPPARAGGDPKNRETGGPSFRGRSNYVTTAEMGLSPRLPAGQATHCRSPQAFGRDKINRYSMRPAFVARPQCVNCVSSGVTPPAPE